MPSKDQTIQRMHIIDRAAVAALAEREGVSVTEMLHRIVQEFIEREHAAGREVVILPHLAESMKGESHD